MLGAIKKRKENRYEKKIISNWVNCCIGNYICM